MVRLGRDGNGRQGLIKHTKRYQTTAGGNSAVAMVVRQNGLRDAGERAKLGQAPARGSGGLVGDAAGSRVGRDRNFYPSPYPTMNHYLLDRDFTVGRTDDRLFGSFVEHLGRAVYSGIFEPGHPTADARGFRGDVLALVRELGVTVVRYPGGNFVSGYRWEDGVGPVAERPRRRELAWMATETNEFGTNEFMAWCREAGIEPMMAVNLGTRGPAEAGEFAEYCNHKSGTALADRRVAHGWAEPHGIRLWCLGNEMDGPWQMGHCDAVEYGRRAREAAKLMRLPDANRSSTPVPALEFVACGSSGRGMPFFGRWEREMLEQCYEQVHYVSLHTYYAAPLDQPGAALMQADAMGWFIDEVAAVCDAVAATKRTTRRLALSFDEWNVWNNNLGEQAWSPAWTVAPPQLEQVYTLLDALLVGGMGLSLLGRADRVKIACLAQLVNVIAPIMTRPSGAAWRQTIFWPFQQLSRHGRGTVLRPAVRAVERVARETLAKAEASAVAGPAEADALQVVAVARDDGGVTVFALNRTAQVRALRVTLRGAEGDTGAGAGKVAGEDWRLEEWSCLAGDDLGATNTDATPDRVRPQRREQEGGATCLGGELAAEVPGFSWNVFVLRSGGAEGAG